jgi:signal transduction histidine kinase
LVALAADLRRASTDGASPDALARMAESAEEAVFTLQDLARGIFPTVLIDQGLAAAIRTQATRIPMDVRVVVEPALVGKRFASDVEAALYFVALESLANAQKHASQAHVTLTLRQDGGDLVIDVYDDGPGFSPSAPTNGTGLQNMADRVAAVDGSLSVDGRAGVGSRISARAAASTVVPLAPRGAHEPTRARR